MKKLIVINHPENLPLKIEGLEIITPKAYITQHEYGKLRNTRVFNLSNDYSYQSKGYYVSLLAEARGHKPIPDVKNIQDVKAPTIIKSMSEEMDERIQASLRKITAKEFTLSVYFGKNLAKHHEKLSHELHKLFPVPMFRARFIQSNQRWILQNVKTLSFKEVPESHLDFAREAATEYFSKKRFDRDKGTSSIYDLAILVNPDESEAPSNKKALQNFRHAAEKLGFYVEFITKDDYNRIVEFDALFIRVTTSVDHYSYRFARRAESEGLVVIDDPSSILKCANKVYLAELLRNNKIPTPNTMIIHWDNKKEVAETLGLPCILKLPDSSFSQGVVKVSTPEELREKLHDMLDESDLVIGQAWTPTDFDWRIGVLDGTAFYACKYYMAKGHWQIYNWASEDREEVTGMFDTFPMDQVPPAVTEIAEKATRLIGRGLYGVDIKDVDGKPLIIEINDNPSIDAGVEDQVLGEEMYERIMRHMAERIQRKIEALNSPHKTTATA